MFYPITIEISKKTLTAQLLSDAHKQNEKMHNYALL